MEQDEAVVLSDLYEILASIVKRTPAELRADAEQRAARAQQRADRSNARYAGALLRITPAQAKVIQELRSGGATVWSKLRQNRESGNVCIFLDKQMYDAAKGRVGRKLYAVYPDGTRTETFERSVSVRASF